MKNRRNVPGYLTDIEFEGGRVGILLFHGLGGTPLEMRFIAQGLTRAGYTVHCPVLPGMTTGTDVLRLSSWVDWYDAAQDEFDELRKTCDTIFVGGLSAGSMIALKLSANHPDKVAGNIVFAPTFWPNGWAVPKSFGLFRFVYTNWFAKLFSFQLRKPFGIKDKRMRKFMIQAFKSEGRNASQVFARPGQMILQFRRLADAVKRKLHKVTAPTIIIHPRNDDQSNLSNALILQAKVAGPVEAYILDDSYHMITLDKQRDVVLSRTLEFVEAQLSALGLDKAAQDARSTAVPSKPALEKDETAKTVAAE